MKRAVYPPERAAIGPCFKNSHFSRENIGINVKYLEKISYDFIEYHTFIFHGDTIINKNAIDPFTILTDDRPGFSQNRVPYVQV